MSDDQVVRLHAVPPASSPLEEAARWFALRRRARNSAEDEQFTAWLEADPANRRAYDEVTRSWEIVGAAATDPALIAMRSEALMMRPRKIRDHSRLWGAAATAALLMVTATGLYFNDPALVERALKPADRHQQVFHTGIGQRAVATLDDGSVVTLNTNSTVVVNFSEAERDVQLVAGQALFKVAHNAARPFIVAAANRQVVAVGTEFEVRLDGNKLRVALLEGRVRVEPIGPRARGEPEATAVLEPGEQLFASASGDVLVKPANVRELVSWQTGRVRFDDTRLADALAEMNRYDRIPMVADPDIANIRISGTFRAGQSGSFAETMSEAFPVEVTRGPDSIRLRKRG